jgi:uncharacterized protein (TIGR02246 family)
MTGRGGPVETAHGAWSEIHRLLYRYIACVDTADAEGTAELFLPQGCLVSHVMGTTCIGRDAIREYISRLRHSWTTISIQLALPHVELLKDSTAQASAYFAAYGERGADHWGLYTDRLRYEEGRWQIEVREISPKGASRHSQRMSYR